MRQILEAFPFETTPKYLLRDRDRIYGEAFCEQVDVMNIKEVLSAPRAPWQRACVECVIGSIRRECLDHVIILEKKDYDVCCRPIYAITTKADFICP